MRSALKKNRLILALDVDNKGEVEELVSSLKETVGYFKIGMRLFFSYGPEIVKFVREKEGAVFLDTKLHDIPSIVEAASRVISRMDVSMITIHALGGVEMMERSVQAVRKENPQTLVLGVTLLTSIDQRILKEELGIQGSLREQVVFLARKAKEAGLTGVVCSGEEVGILREELGEDFILVVPGIRLQKLALDEQKRVLTPGEAIHRGADYLVVGRPILQAPDPVRAAKEILEMIDSASD